MTLKGPDFGITKMPPGEAPASYPDMESEKLEGSIETQGARLAWSRASVCPCAPINDQTQQPNPNCALCGGRGVYYFGPSNYAAPEEAGALTSVQKAILAIDGAAVIRGIVARASSRQEPYDVLGRWIWGQMQVSTRHENKLAYFDRLVALDSEMVFDEVVIASANTQTIPLRYRAIGINQVRSVSAVYREGIDYELQDTGVLRWLSSRIPTSATRISVHYNMHPTWIVTDHPHVIREIGRRRRGPKLTPLGTPTALPMTANVQLEFLPVPRTA